jgi:hypothetical protein
MRLRAQQHTRVFLVEDRLVVPPIALGHIDSCAEGPITIGLDDRNVDVVVFSSAAPSGGDLAGHTFVKRIQLFWPAQRQSRDMTVHAESNCSKPLSPVTRSPRIVASCTCSNVGCGPASREGAVRTRASAIVSHSTFVST